jgi:hypothetical protein
LDWSVDVPAQRTAADASGYWDKIPEKMHASIKYALEHGWYFNPYQQEVSAVNWALIESVAKKTTLQAALEQAKSKMTPSP